MTRRAALRVAMLSALALLSTACAPPWRVVRASGPPSALAGMSSLGVTFDYSLLMMGGMPEAQWLSTQPPDDQASYLAVRTEMERQFLAELGSQLAPLPVRLASGDESHVIVVRHTRIEMGAYRVMFALDSYLDSDFALGPTGALTDEIVVYLSRTANLYNPTIEGRMSYLARRGAQLVASFIRQAR